jgi:hypothetical protein
LHKFLNKYKKCPMGASYFPPMELNDVSNKSSFKFL